MYFDAEDYAQIPMHIKEQADFIFVEDTDARWDGEYPLEKYDDVEKQILQYISKEMEGEGQGDLDRNLHNNIGEGTFQLVARDDDGDITEIFEDNGEGDIVDEDGTVVKDSGGTETSATIDYSTGDVDTELPGDNANDDVTMTYGYERFNAIGDVKDFAAHTDRVVAFLPLQGLGDVYNI